jgi:hydroxyacylglutathione hydrolase
LKKKKKKKKKKRLSLQSVTHFRNVFFFVPKCKSVSSSSISEGGNRDAMRKLICSRAAPQQQQPNQTSSTMKVVVVEVNKDNLSYLVIDEQSREAWAIDPAEPAKVLAAAEREQVRIVAILTTHHHADHAGGNAELHAALNQCPVIGGSPQVQAANRIVREGDVIELGSLRCSVRQVPFHTQDSLFYVVADAADAAAPLSIFTGDSIFAAGAGRFFEGTAAECDAALNGVFKSLPDEALVWFGHEYTVANARYALTVDPDNVELQEVLKSAVERREAGLCTAPTTVAREKATNPFLRCDTKAIQSAVGGESVIETLDRLRTAKNNWRG